MTVYAFFALVTAGHLYRAGRTEWRRRVLQVITVPFWPIYWIVHVGTVKSLTRLFQSCTVVGGHFMSAVATTSVRALRSTTMVIEAFIAMITTTALRFVEGTGRVADSLSGTVGWTYLAAAAMFPAYYLYFAWDACEASWCWTAVARAILWAPFWPAYAIASISGPAPA